jgi:hypothetical protein
MIAVMKVDLTANPVPEVWDIAYPVGSIADIVAQAEGLVAGNTEPERTQHHEVAAKRLGCLRVALGSFTANAAELVPFIGGDPNDTQVSLGELMDAADVLAADEQPPFQVVGATLDHGGWVARRAIEVALIARLIDE